MNSGQQRGSGGATTASMAAYADMRTHGHGVHGHAGLVLLYAPAFEELQPAFPLFGEHAMIGREPPADVLIPQPAVSRSHARLSQDPHGWTITDLGARNGTLVDGNFVKHERLRPLAEVRVGDAFFKFVTHDCAGYLPYRIDGAVLNAPATPTGLVGGYQMAVIASWVRRISLSPISIVVLGESGTGKEVLARQIHRWSNRSGAFCALNCAAIPPTLLESELFGYRRGAFSGAERDHVGLVRAADQGTLFLDEVGDMPLEAQAKLLRVLQTKEVLPLGATTPEQVDVRVVCATHRDLGAMQQSGEFRRDLFARLNEYSVTLPPLRERKEDIYALCIEFLRQHKRPDLKLSVPYLTGLLHYSFPYNVRELEALIKRGIALVDGPELRAEHLSEEIQAHMQHYGRQGARVVARPTGPAHNPWLADPRARNPGPPRERLPTQDPPIYERGTPASSQPYTNPYQAYDAASQLTPHPGAHSSAYAPAQAPSPHAAPHHAGAHIPGAQHPGPHYPAAAPLSAPLHSSGGPPAGAHGGSLDPRTAPSVQAYSDPVDTNVAGYVPSETELRAALDTHQGNVAAVGRQFGKERMQVHRWMRRYHIDPNDYRDKPR